MRTAASITASLAALAIAGCGGSSSSSTRTATTSGGGSATSTTASTGGCRTVRLPRPEPAPHLKAPTLRLDPKRTYVVTIVTNCGKFAFALNVRQSPKTSASVYSLVKHGFYNQLIFQRVAAGFVIQGGDPTQTGAGGPGYTVVEAPPKNTQYVAGDVAMAKTETQPSGASGSQFFIVTAPNATESAGLTPDYALVGKVVSGMSVVQTIGRLSTNPSGDGEPTKPVVMSSVTVSTDYPLHIN
jgi:peptidyl-prolyl cis-trans isomerase B (cyclophilin B)